MHPKPITYLRNSLPLPLMVSTWIFLMFYLPYVFCDPAKATKEFCARFPVTSSLSPGHNASVSSIPSIYGSKCGPNTKWKLGQQDPSELYREQIQLANRKFCWPCVYMFDVQTRTRVASRKDTDVSLDVLDTTLYTTILDASALRAHPKQCTRCK